MNIEQEARKYMEYKYETVDFKSYQDMASETAVYKTELMRWGIVYGTLRHCVVT